MSVRIKCGNDAPAFLQGLKPESFLAVGGTLRRASLAQGRLRTEAVPFPIAAAPDHCRSGRAFRDLVRFSRALAGVPCASLHAAFQLC